MKFMESIEQQQEAAEAYGKVKDYEKNHPALFLAVKEAVRVRFANPPSTFFDFEAELPAPYGKNDFEDCLISILEIRAIEMQLLLNKMQIMPSDSISEEKAILCIKEIGAELKKNQALQFQISIEDYAAEHGHRIVKKDWQYLWREDGQVVCTDNRAALLKFSPLSAVEIQFDELPHAAAKPQTGEWFEAKFSNNVIISCEKIIPEGWQVRLAAKRELKNHA